jgi:exosortase
MNDSLKSGPTYLRHGFFLGLFFLAVGIFHHGLFFVLRSSVSVDHYSHILLVLPVSAALLYLTRKRALAQVSYWMPAGIFFLVLLAGFFYAAAHASEMDPSVYLSLSILLFAACIISAFVFCYGTQAFRTAMFPLLFLLLMTPLPDAVLHRFISMLQNGSAVATCWLYSLAHIPYVRHGVVIALPKLEIYIAEECSGIRSTMVLLLCSIVLGYLYLKSPWTRILLFLAVFPITVAKNGLRIFVLSTLGMYVDPSFLTGRLHHQGGFIFFGLAFALLFLLIWLFRKLRMDPGTGDSSRASRPSVLPAAKN